MPGCNREASIDVPEYMCKNLQGASSSYPESHFKSVFDIQMESNPNTSPNVFSLPSF